jgi:hypothetical protein
LLPQPKLNFDIALLGVACSRTMALGTFPPVVQALTTHCAAAPRLLLRWELAIWTQRRTFVEPWTPDEVDDPPESEASAGGEEVAVAEEAADADEEAAAVGDAVPVWEGAADGDGECDGDGDALALAFDFALGDFDGVG